MNRPIVCSILVYITVYWWCITRPSYSHYEHIYIHITCGPVPFLKPLLGRNGRAAASCQVDHWDDSAAAGCPLMFQPTPGSNGSGTSESKNWKRWGWERWERGTAPGYELYHVIPCYTPNKSRVAIPSYCTMLPLQHCWMLGSIQIVGITHIIIILVNHQLFIYTILITNQQSE